MRFLGAMSILVSVLAVVVGCGDTVSPARSTPPADDPDKPLIVYVVNYPLQFLAERIGGENVDVVFPAPTDVDPAFWSPDAEIVAAYQQADLILLNGAGYARWVTRVSLPRAAKVNTGAGWSPCRGPPR